MAPAAKRPTANAHNAAVSKKGKTSACTADKENDATNSQNNRSPNAAGKTPDCATPASTASVADKERVLLPFKTYCSLPDSERRKMVFNVLDDVVSYNKVVTAKDIEDYLEPREIIQMFVDSLILVQIYYKDSRSKRQTVAQLEAKLKAVEQKLTKEKNFVNTARWKEEAKLHINHKLMDKLFRRFIFLHPESSKTNDILKDTIVTGAHPFAKEVFDHLFAVFKTVDGDAELSKRIASSEPNIYSKGNDHLLDNAQCRDEIWADIDFSSYVIRAFNTKRNSMARAIRVLCRKLIIGWAKVSFIVSILANIYICCISFSRVIFL